MKRYIKTQEFSGIELMQKQTSLLVDEESSQMISYEVASRDAISSRSQLPCHPLMMPTIQIVHDNFKLGIFYIVIGVFSYAIMAFVSKLLYIKNPQITCWDVMLTRGIMTAFYLWMQWNFDRISLIDFKGYFVKVMCAAWLGSTLYTCCLLSYQYVSVTKATLILYANPIVVVVLAYFLLDERLSKTDIFCLLLVLGGGFMTTMHAGDTSKDIDPELGYFFATIACILMGVVLVLQRDINMNLSPYVLPFYMSIAFIIPWLFVLFGTDTIQLGSYSLVDFVMILIISTTGVAGLVFTGVAYKYAEASILGPFWNLEVIFLWVCEATILGYEFIYTDFIGAGFILGGLLGMLILKQK